MNVSDSNTTCLYHNFDWSRRGNYWKERLYKVGLNIAHNRVSFKSEFKHKLTSIITEQ